MIKYVFSKWRSRTLLQNKQFPRFYVAPTLVEKPATLKAAQMVSEVSEPLIKDCIMTTDTD